MYKHTSSETHYQASVLSHHYHFEVEKMTNRKDSFDDSMSDEFITILE